MNRRLGFFLICAMLNGCAQLPPEKRCYSSNNDTGELTILKSNAKALEWFDLYVTSNQLPRDTRESYLSSLDQLLNINKTHDINITSIANTANESNVNENICYRSLQLHKATYLASRNADRTSWQDSITLLTNIDNPLPSGMIKYAHWLQSELSTRLDLAETADQLKKENTVLAIRVNRLQKKIEALTNIEQRLTEKKGALESY